MLEEGDVISQGQLTREMIQSPILDSLANLLRGFRGPGIAFSSEKTTMDMSIGYAGSE